MKEFLTKYAFVLFGLFALAVSGLSYGIVASAEGADEDRRAGQLQDLEQEYLQRQEQMREESQRAYDEILGTDYTRVSSDEELIRGLLTTALNWDSQSSYDAAREQVMADYEISEDSHFLQTFLPPAEPNTDSRGNEYSYINAAGLNSRLGDFNVEVLSVVQTDYRYLVSVSSESLSDDDMQAASNTSVVLMTIDGEGVISDVSGYAEDADFPRQYSGTGFDEDADSTEGQE